MNEPFLNCKIFSISMVAVDGFGFHLLEKVYYYNSLKDIVSFGQYCVQIPEYEIKEIQKLSKVDIDTVITNNIPIIRKIIGYNNEYWKVDLTHYENYQLQPSNIPSN